MFSPNYGFNPQTRQEILKNLFKDYQELTGNDCNFRDFQGSNIHVLFNIFANHLERLEASFSSLLIQQFQFWANSLIKVNGSFGSSYEGWTNSFKDLCTSIDIISSDDKRINNLEEEKKPKPGEIIVYFDNLNQDKEKEKDIHDAWIRCKNIAEPTKDGDKEITLHFSNGDSRKYHYFNLEPENYTKLILKFKPIYQTNSIKYPDKLFKDHILENFNNINRINKAFYPKACFNITHFPGIADVEISSKLTTETDKNFTKDIREIALGNKYIIQEIVIDVRS